MRRAAVSNPNDAMLRRRIRCSIYIVCIALVVVPLSVSAAIAHPCDRHPNDPRCAGTTTTTTTQATTSTTTTTTTMPQASTTTTAAPPGDGVPLGIVSGSNGDRYWNEAVESLGLPSTTVNLGGGDTHRWGTPINSRYATYWATFDEHAAHGPVDVWWYALSRSNTTDEADAEAEADTIVAQILTLRPDATIHASTMAAYDPDTCTSDNVPMSEHLVAYAIATFEEVIAGPVIPTVTTTTDGCHPGGESLTAGAAVVAAWAAGLGG